jgi:NitT/TauT family transport system substrate-binding protein
VNVLIGGPNSEIEKRVALDPFGLGIVQGDAVFIAVERGLPVIAVNSYFQHDPQGVMVRADSPVRTFADLDDHDLAMQVGAPWLMYLQKKYGLAKIRVRPVTGSVANFVRDPNWITQAYPTSEPIAAKEGVAARMIQISDSGFDPYRVIIANRELVTGIPMVAEFSLGAYRGWQEYFRDPQPIHEHLLKISTHDGAGGHALQLREDAGAEAGGGRSGPKGSPWAAFEPSAGRNWDKILLDLGVIQKPVALSEVVTFALHARGAEASTQRFLRRSGPTPMPADDPGALTRNREPSQLPPMPKPARLRA